MNVVLGEVRRGTLVYAALAAHTLPTPPAAPLGFQRSLISSEQIDHVIGADVVYHGFGEETDPSGRGLEKTLAARAIGP